MTNSLITVIGSYAVGMTIKTKRFPVAGETVQGKDFSILHGGKGSNQAVACARLGGNVFYFTCLGKDSFGENAMKLYDEEGIDASHVMFSDDLYTGVGLVTVNEEGENQITIDIGANKAVRPEDIDKLLPMIRKSNIVLMQLELEMEAIEYAAMICKREGIPLLLNPAPYQELPEGIIDCCEYLTPNETETRLLMGLAPNDRTPNEEIAKELHKKGAKNVIVTMDNQGAIIVNDDGYRHMKAFSVDVVDSTGAGDTFSAALAVALSEGRTLAEAVHFANAAGALTVTKYGVIPAQPTRAEVDSFMRQYKPLRI